MSFLVTIELTCCANIESRQEAMRTQFALEKNSSFTNPLQRINPLERLRRIETLGKVWFDERIANNALLVY